MASVTIAHYSGSKSLKVRDIKHDHAIAINDYVSAIDYANNPTREGFKNILGFVIGKLDLGRQFLSFEKSFTSGAEIVTKASAINPVSQVNPRDSVLEGFRQALNNGVWFG
jgi:hypothetical protein